MKIYFDSPLRICRENRYRYSMLHDLKMKEVILNDILKNEVVEKWVANKVAGKELFLPVFIIDKVNAFIDLVIAVRNQILPSRKSDESRFRNTFPVNCAFYYTNFYFQTSKKDPNRWHFANENRMRKKVGDPQIIESIKYLLTNYYEVSTPKNSNSKIVKLLWNNKLKPKIRQEEPELIKLSSHLLSMVTPERKKLVSREDIYKMLVEGIDREEPVYQRFMDLVDTGFCIEVKKSDSKGGGKDWNNNLYKIPEEVLSKENGLIFEEESIPSKTTERLYNIYSEDADTYGIGDDVCFSDYCTASKLDYSIDYKAILNTIKPELNDRKVKKTGKLITADMQIEVYEKSFEQVVKSIPDIMAYKRAGTLDRHYNPYQRMKSVLRKQVNELNGFIEVDYKSAQLNVIIAVAVGDFDETILYKELYSSTYKAVVDARKKAKFTEADKKELRGYYGDFYQNLLDRFELTYNRKQLKSDTVAFLNIQGNQMKHFESLMQEGVGAFEQSIALQRLRYFIELIKTGDNKEAYRVLFKVESILIREVILSCIEKGIPTICIHDAICCPKEHAETVRELMDQMAKQYNVLTYAEIEPNTEVSISNEADDAFIESCEV